MPMLGGIDVKRLAGRAVFLVILSAAVALVVNHLRSERLDLFGYRAPARKVAKAAWRAGRPEAAVEQIDLETALKLHSTPGTLFVDARRKADFEAGHIANALSLPVESFDEAFGPLKQRLKVANSVVVYCSDPECDDAQELAEALRSTLGRRILLFPGGMAEWRGKGPIER